MTVDIVAIACGIRVNGRDCFVDFNPSFLMIGKYDVIKYLQCSENLIKIVMRNLSALHLLQCVVRRRYLYDLCIESSTFISIKVEVSRS